MADANVTAGVPEEGRERLVEADEEETEEEVNDEGIDASGSGVSGQTTAANRSASG